MIIFEQLVIEGFASIHKLTFDFQSQGLFLVKGKNGVGKTTIFSALFWVIFGDSLKKRSTITPWENKRHPDYCGTQVSITFRKGENKYEIIRCLEYTKKVEGSKGGNRIIFKVNGENIQVKGKRGINEEILNVIGVSEDLFKNSIIFGQKMKRLIEDTGTEKKKIFEEAFNIGFINDAIEVVNKDNKELLSLIKQTETQLSEIETKKLKAEHQIELIKSKYQTQLESYEKLKAEYTNQIGVLEERKKTNPYRKEIKKLKEELLSYPKYSDELKDRLDKLIKSSQKEEQELRVELSLLKIEKLNLKEHQDKCPSCNRPFDKKEIKEHNERVNKRKETLGMDIFNTQTRLTVVKKLLDSHLSERAKEQSNKEKREEIKAKIIKFKNGDNDYINQEIGNLNKWLSKLEKPKEPIISMDLSSLEVEINNHKKILKKLNRKLEVNQWLLKNPLANKGLKSYIFDIRLNQINDALKEYSHILKFKPVFMVDMEGANKDIVVVIYYDDTIVLYEDLSGGQQQLVNVATALALHDIITHSLPFNILVLDELFENLDSDNIEKVSELISMKAKNTGIYLITHIKDFIMTGANEINLKLVEGQTKTF